MTGDLKTIEINATECGQTVNNLRKRANNLTEISSAPLFFLRGIVDWPCKSSEREEKQFEHWHWSEVTFMIILIFVVVHGYFDRSLGNTTHIPYLMCFYSIIFFSLYTLFLLFVIFTLCCCCSLREIRFVTNHFWLDGTIIKTKAHILLFFPSLSLSVSNKMQISTHNHIGFNYNFSFWQHVRIREIDYIHANV